MQSNGFAETVAPLGTALTADHIATLCKSNRNITFCFDGDNAGQKAAARAAAIVMPFVRDTSDVRFAFVTGGKDPDEILKTGGADAMRKIIDDSVPLVDFLWNLANTNFVVATPGGRAQAEKFLDTETEKLTDATLRAQVQKEYDARKFNQWNKWSKKKKDAPQVSMPKVDEITRTTLIYIANTFPALGERYGEFLASLGVDFDAPARDMQMNLDTAERFIVSVKLQKYMEKLATEKKNACQKC